MSLCCIGNNIMLQLTLLAEVQRHEFAYTIHQARRSMQLWFVYISLYKKVVPSSCLMYASPYCFPNYDSEPGLRSSFGLADLTQPNLSSSKSREVKKLENCSQNRQFRTNRTTYCFFFYYSSYFSSPLH